MSVNLQLLGQRRVGVRQTGRAQAAREAGPATPGSISSYLSPSSALQCRICVDQLSPFPAMAECCPKETSGPPRAAATAV